MDCSKYQRWDIALDMNCDGAFSTVDAWGWVLYVFFTPGDLLIWTMISAPMVSDLFTVGVGDYGGGFSIGMSIIAWLMIASYIAAAPVIHKRQ